MRIVIRRNGSTRVVETTQLDYGSSIIIQADYLSAVDVEKNGLLLDRCAYTSYEDGRMSVKPEPIEILSPDELAEVEQIEVDGMVFMERAAGALRAVLVDQIYDEDGNLDPPPSRGVRVYYRSGSYEAIDATPLSYPDGYIAVDDVIDHADVANGLSWDRGVWTSSDPELMSLKPEAVQVIDPESVAGIEAVCVEGAVVYPGGGDRDGQEDEGGSAEDEEGGSS